MTAPEVPATDKRVLRTRARVLETTYGLLTERGIGGVSIDDVSRRSGVAKTTIYRHWPSRSALLLDACSSLGNAPQTPATGTLAGDLGKLVRRLADDLASAPWATVLPSIIDAAERDPEIARVQAALNATFAAPFIAAFDQAKEAGQLATSVSSESLAAQVLGPLFYRRWFSKEPIGHSFVAEVIAAVTRGTESDPARGAAIPDRVGHRLPKRKQSKPRTWRGL